MSETAHCSKALIDTIVTREGTNIFCHKPRNIKFIGPDRCNMCIPIQPIEVEDDQLNLSVHPSFKIQSASVSSY